MKREHPGPAESMRGTCEARARELLERARAASARALHARAASLCAMGLDLAPAAACEVPLRELRARSFAALGRHDEAAEELGRVGAIAGDDDAGRNAEVGAELLRAGRPAKASEPLARAAARAPQRSDVALLLADAQVATGQWADAAASYRRAAALCPGERWIRVALAKALHRAHDLATAASILDEALREAPDDVRALIARAAVRQGMGEPARAAGDAERAVALAPDDAEAHMARAYAHLALEDYEVGFREYEWRLPDRGRRARLGLPPWEGGDPAGRVIVVWTEQGNGDILQFVRYVPALVRAGARTVLCAPRRLVRLLRSCPGIGEIAISGGTLPAGQSYAMLMSLPHLLAAPASSGDGGAYLHPEPPLSARWRERVARAVGGRRRRLAVALAWQGNPAYDADRWRSMPLRVLEPLLRRFRSDVVFFSVQKSFGREQLGALPDDVRPFDWAEEVDVGEDAFIDSAAALAAMDLVITTDTSIAHLAGALGVPGWVLLSAAPEWRWGRADGRSRWYPSLTTYRQDTLGDWGSVARRVQSALEARIAVAAGAAGAAEH